jgi:hypothetical protein
MRKGNVMIRMQIQLTDQQAVALRALAVQRIVLAISAAAGEGWSEVC